MYVAENYGNLYSVDFASGVEPRALRAVTAEYFEGGFSRGAMGTIAFNPSGEAFVIAAKLNCYPWCFGIFKWSGQPTDQLVLWNTGAATPKAGELAVNAAFRFPWGVAIDANGNMLISDMDNYQVWLVKASDSGAEDARLLTPVAGTGTYGRNLVSGDPTATCLWSPAGVAFGPGGRSAYITDSYNCRILKVMLECVGA
jgi:sugar lactone lactonase YvrE